MVQGAWADRAWEGARRGRRGGPEKYAEHFAKYIAEDFEPVDLEEAMEGVLDAIREDPVHVKKARSKPADAKSWKPKKLTYDERKAALKAKLEAIVADA